MEAINNPLSSPHANGHKHEFGKFELVELIENHYHIPTPAPQRRIPINSFIYLKRGEIYVEIGSDSILLKEGEMLIIPALEPITIKYYSHTMGYVGGFSSNIFSDLSQNIEERYDFLHQSNTSCFSFNEEQKVRINDLFDKLAATHKLDKENSKLTNTYLLCLLQELSESNSRLLSQTPHNHLVHRFFEILFLDSPKNFKPTDYAHELNITVNHLNKVIRTATGKSVSAWIEEKLVVKAKNLLRNNELSIADIAKMLDIDDQAYFTRKFKQHEGITPSEYRKGF